MNNSETSNSAPAITLTAEEFEVLAGNIFRATAATRASHKQYLTHVREQLRGEISRMNAGNRAIVKSLLECFIKQHDRNGRQLSAGFRTAGLTFESEAVESLLNGVSLAQHIGQAHRQTVRGILSEIEAEMVKPAQEAARRRMKWEAA